MQWFSIPPTWRLPKSRSVPTTVQKSKDVQFTVTKDKEQQKIFTFDKLEHQIFDFFLHEKKTKKKTTCPVWSENADFPTCSQYSTTDLWCFYHEWMKAKPDTREKLNQINISIIIIRAETNDYFHDRWICRLFIINNFGRNQNLAIKYPKCLVLVQPTAQKLDKTKKNQQLIFTSEKLEPSILFFVIFAWKTTEKIKKRKKKNRLSLILCYSTNRLID